MHRFQNECNLRWEISEWKCDCKWKSGITKDPETVVEPGKCFLKKIIAMMYWRQEVTKRRHHSNHVSVLSLLCKTNKQKRHRRTNADQTCFHQNGRHDVDHRWLADWKLTNNIMKGKSVNDRKWLQCTDTFFFLFSWMKPPPLQRRQETHCMYRAYRGNQFETRYYYANLKISYNHTRRRYVLCSWFILPT